MRKPLARVTIKKECREIHGIEGAFDKAYKEMKRYYLIFANSQGAENRVWELELHIKKNKP